MHGAKDTATGCIAMVGCWSTNRSQSARRVVSAVWLNLFTKQNELLSMQGTKQAIDGSSGLTCDVCEYVVFAAD